MNARRSIVLIGFMGSGKSTVGEALARHLGWPKIETDELVAAEFGMPIAQVFDRFGEEKFRETESAIIGQIAPQEPTVIVTGGGIVLRPENVKRLRELGLVIWLTADLAALVDRLGNGSDRPLLRGESRAQQVEALCLQREKFYTQAADLVFKTSNRSVTQTVEEICRALDFA